MIKSVQYKGEGRGMQGKRAIMLHYELCRIQCFQSFKVKFRISASAALIFFKKGLL